MNKNLKLKFMVAFTLAKNNFFAAHISKQIILQNTSDKNDKYEVEMFPIARSIMFTSIQMIIILARQT